jgi:hypothetical protein
MMKIFRIFLILSFSLSTYASDYVAGTGSSFNLSMEKGGNANLNIIISESSFTKLGIEYHFSTSGLLATNMWQQFVFKIIDGGPLAIEAGYVKTPELPKPEELTSEYLNVNRGVQVNDFLFAKKEEIEKFKIGQELVEVPAGEIIATHYRKSRNGQIVDFWIADEAKPIGLVKLKSHNDDNIDHNYTIELTSLLKNVKATIDPKEAVPLTDKGKEFLAKPLEKFKKSK